MTHGTETKITATVSHHIETSQLICITNQLNGFYMIGTLLVTGLTEFLIVLGLHISSKIPMLF